MRRGHSHASWLRQVDSFLKDMGTTEAEGVPSQGGRGDALLQGMSPHQT